MQEHMDFIEFDPFEAPANYRLDERTKAIGRQGLAAARARLAAIPPVEWHTSAA